MKPQDLDRFRVLSTPRMHPSEDRGVFVVTRLNLDKDRYDASIWTWEGEVVREVPGTAKARSPEWSPDGSRLAFLQTVPDDPDKTGDDAEKHAQLAVRDGAGDPRVLTRCPLGVSAFRWSPQGDRILMVAGKYAEDWAKLDKKERGARPRRITAVPWRFDAQGTYDDRRPVLALVDPTGQRKPRHLDLPADVVEIEDLAWHSSGRRAAVMVQRYEPRHRNRFMDAILEIDLDSGTFRERHSDGGWGGVVYAGDRLVGVGVPAVYRWPEPYSLWEIPESGDPVPLLPDLDRMLAMVRPVGDSLYFLYEDQGRQHLARWTQDGAVRTLNDDVPFISDFDARPHGSDLVFVTRAPTDPGELCRASGGAVTTLTTLNADFRADVALAEPRHLVVDTGGAEVDTWVYLPPGEGPFPVLLNIHGGPATQYGFGFFDEFQVYAGAGYAVVACNPRGSSGRGKSHLRAVRNEAWGVVDEQDILACLDAALDRVDGLDRERVGVMGGSYGGFMTAWLIGRHHRFRSAIVERGLLNWITFGHTSDIATVFSPMYFDDGGTPELLWEKSPLRFADQVTTPTLILHSEQDWRCPVEQAEQYLAALLRAGVTAEFLRFPGESHELSRSGDPKHRRARFEAVLEWHGRFLG